MSRQMAPATLLPPCSRQTAGARVGRAHLLGRQQLARELATGHQALLPRCLHLPTIVHDDNHRLKVLVCTFRLQVLPHGRQQQGRRRVAAWVPWWARRACWQPVRSREQRRAAAGRLRHYSRRELLAQQELPPVRWPHRPGCQHLPMRLARGASMHAVAQQPVRAARYPPAAARRTPAQGGQGPTPPR